MAPIWPDGGPWIPGSMEIPTGGFVIDPFLREIAAASSEEAQQELMEALLRQADESWQWLKQQAEMPAPVWDEA